MSSNKDPVKSSDIWLDDGNIVISAVSRSDTSRILFKCHGSVLAMHSPVFQDMFRVPQPQEGSQYEGTPIVELPDAAEDVRDLIRTIYDPAYLPYERYDPKSVLKMTGVLRLSTKYGIKPLRRRIVEYFRSAWPQSLCGWDRREEEISGVLHDWIQSHYDPEEYYANNYFPEPAAVIRFAREMNILSILCCAYYDLMRMNWDEPIGLTIDPEWSQPCYLDRTPQLEHLDVSDCRRIIVGRQRVRAVLGRESWIYSGMFKTSQQRDRACARKTMLENNIVWGCKDDVKRWWDGVMPKKLLNMAHSSDPLFTLKTIGSDLGASPPSLVCVSCIDWLRREIKVSRETIWTELPTCFNLPHDINDHDDMDVV